MKREFQVGEKIKFVGPFNCNGQQSCWENSPQRAEILQVWIDRLKIKAFGRDGFIHPRQITHRIRKKEKRKPREIWLNLYPNGTCFQWPSKEEAERAKSTVSNGKPETIHFREVLDGKGNTP